MDQTSDAPGLCECGCGQAAPIAPYNDKTYGWVKGQPKRFMAGHWQRAQRKNAVTAGQRFGSGVVTDADFPISLTDGRAPRRGALLLCDCGTAYEALVDNLMSGAKTSCGCENRARLSSGRRNHGMRHHPLYATWKSMLERCENPAQKAFHRYGGRGISVCERWHDVRLFIADVEREIGPRPDGWTFDRTDNDGDYRPGNIRWATRAMQSNNRACTQVSDIGRVCHICDGPVESIHKTVTHCSRSCAATCRNAGGCRPRH